MSDGMAGARPVTPAQLRALTRTRRVTRDIAEDLLTHLPDLGDLPTQRLLDAWVEQAADTMRALTECAEEHLLGASSPAPASSSSRGTGDPR